LKTREPGRSLASDALSAPQSQFHAWIAYTVAAPVCVFCVSWPIAYLMGIPHPFLATFSTADLIPLAALVLFGAAADVENDALFSGVRSTRLMVFKHGISVGAIVVLAAYGALKAKALILLATPQLTAAALRSLVAFSVVSILILAAALSGAYYVKLLLVRAQVAAMTASPNV
jgi:hypothetical protein